MAVLVDEIAEREAASGELTAPSQSTGKVVDALEALGLEPVEVALHEGDVGTWLKRLIDEEFLLAFNLCETVAGIAEGEYRAAAAVELLEIPMTGASAATLLYCLQKDRCSAVLRAHGIPVPDWRLVRPDDPVPADWSRFPAIVKPAAQDGSNGVHANSLADDTDTLHAAIDRMRPAWGNLLIQRYIAGREINIAIVGESLLPPAEIDFTTLPDDSPSIVSFEAKWYEESTDYQGTIPVCPAPLEPERTEALQRMAARAWQAMGGRGYARVDFRLEDGGEPFVIDVNPNPDLSLDAGLARQARAAGWSYEDLIGEIVRAALGATGNGAGPMAWPCLPAVEPQEGLR